MKKILALSDNILPSSPRARRLAEKVMCFDQFNQLMANFPEHADIKLISDIILEQLNITLDYRQQDLELIPKQGPLIIVANHPFGGIDGVILTNLILKVRPDLKVLANYLLTKFTPVANLFIEVDPFKTSQANIAGLKQSLQWLKQGGVLGVFPSGTVSHWHWREKSISDPPWSDTPLWLAEQSQAQIMPWYILGNNSWYFQLAGICSAKLRTALIPQQFFAKKNQRISVKIGLPISLRQFDQTSSRTQKTKYLRYRTDLLKNIPTQKTTYTPPVNMEIIGTEIAATTLADEINKLPEDTCLVNERGYSVFLASAQQIPNTLLEIGRLREIAFRQVGEGSLLARDLDNYDQTYHHLFIWQHNTKKIIGACRLGFTDKIVAAQGIQALYLSSLYSFDENFFSAIQPAIEIGRFFIALGYQKKYLVLPLLWKAIGNFITKNPHYISFWGVTSISNAYHSLSKDILTYYLHHAHFDEKLASFAHAKNPYLSAKNLPSHVNNLLKLPLSSTHIESMLREIESDRKGIPTLLEFYRNNNVKFCGFSIDPQFNNCLDCLSVGFIKNVQHNQLCYYMGEDKLLEYQHFHGIKTDGSIAN